MEELLEIRQKMGTKAFSEKVTKPKMRKIRGSETKTTNAETRKIAAKRPLEKHAPEEASSKIKPKKFRQVVPVEKREKVGDPRFREDVTEFNQTAFD